MESELSRVVDALPGFVWTAFPDGRIDFLNQRWCEYTGVEVDRSCGPGWQAAIHPEDLSGLLTGWQGVPAASAPVETEARVRGSDGHYRWFLFRAHPSAGGSGQAVKWCGLSTDIDDRKQAEERAEALLAGEKQLLEMVASGRPMAGILEALCRLVESVASGCCCSIVLLDPSGTKLREAIAPSLAAEFNDAVRGWPLHRIGGPCTTAARDNIQVIMADVASDTRWRNGWRALAQAHGLRSCWSTPIVSQAGKVLGTFALYQREPGSPSPPQLDLISQFTNIASIAIERAQHDAALRLSEARKAAILDSALDCIVTMDHEGRITEFNPAAERTFGFRRDEVLGATLAETIVPPSLRERHRQGLAHHLATGEARVLGKRVEMTAVRADGAEFPVEVAITRIPSEEPPSFTAVLRDITERKKAEAALRDSELNSRLVVDSIPGFVAIMTPAGEIEAVNNQLVEYCGRTLEELTQWGTNGTVHPEDLPHVAQVFTQSIAAGESYDFEARIRRFDGVYRWLQVRGLPLRDTSGRIVRWYVLLTDVDERKRGEEALRQSEARLAAAERDLQLMIDTIPVFVAAYQPDGTRSFVNRTWQDYMGLALAEATGTGARTFPHFHPDDAELNDKAWRASLASGEPLSIEVRVRRADGQYRWHTSRRVPLRDEKGDIVRWYSVGIDIEDQKVAEAALRQSETRLGGAERELRLTLDSIPTITWRAAPNGYVQHLNKRWFDYTGTTPEQVRGWRWKLCIHPDDLDQLVEIGTQYVTSGKPIDGEARVRRFDGTYRWFLFRPAPARDETGKIIAWYGTILDIEDRKRAEEALRESEARLAEAERELQLTIDTIPTLVATYRPDGSRIFVNQTWREYTGYSLADAVDAERTSIVHPDDAARVAPEWQAALAAGTPLKTELRLRRADGEYRWHAVQRVFARDEAGQIVKWYSVGADIEDQRRTEAALKRSETLLAQGQQLSLTGTFSWLVDTDEVTFSEELHRIFEFDPNDALTLGQVRARVHPEDIPLLSEQMDRVRAGHGYLGNEIRLRMPDGRVKHLRTFGRVIRHQDGRLECLAAVQDVTQRQLAEVALDKVRSELAHVTRVMSLGALTASVAHEVNQPLAGIITNASTCLRMLAADPPNLDGARETARRTIRDGNRAADVIARLRALFSKQATATETVDLNEAAQEVLALVSSDLLRSRVILRAELGSEPLLVTGDRVQLQQVILNLVRNASDAMSGVHDRPRHLLIRTDTEEGGRARLSVQDAGIGFDLQAVERLFDAFYSTKSDGMGIGLSVSRSIIERHGGKLWAEPNDGPGATFAFSIPWQAASAGGEGTPGAILTRPTTGAHDVMRNP